MSARLLDVDETALIVHSPAALTTSNSVAALQRNVESESSLPAAPTQQFCSSHLLATQYPLAPMEDGSSKSEPVAPQSVQQIQDVRQTPNRAKRANSDDTERPVSAQRDRRDGAEEGLDIDAEQEHSDYEDADLANPAEQISHFNWDELHQRYHATIKQFNDEEKELMGEWEDLMEVLLQYVSCHMTGC